MSDWIGVVPEGHETCPGCGAKERIARDHADGLELGCRRCPYIERLPTASLPDNWKPRPLGQGPR